MAYVITGATGHIGNNLVRMLVSNNEEVRVIVRKIDESLENLPIEFIIGNFYEEETLEKAIKEGDVLIHLAGYIDLKNNKKKETFFINYESIKGLAEFAYRKKVKKFVYSSSVDAIYKEKKVPIYEKDYLDTSKLKSNYSLSKALGTNYLIDFKKDHPDFNMAIFYPSGCVGINDYKPSAIGKVIKDVIKGKMEFGVSGGYSFVDVRDVSQGIIEICKRDKQGSYIFSGEIVSIMELYTMINRVLGIKRIKIKVPLCIVKLSIPFVPYLSKFALKTINDNCDYRSDKAIKDLDFTARPFIETIEDTVEWFKKRV